MAESAVAAMFAEQIDRVLRQCSKGVEGLSLDQIRDTGGGKSNSPGFDVWHMSRTIDNVIHFVFSREQPVWAQQGLAEAWGFPKNDQGTGMDESDAHALPFPDAAELGNYSEAVRAAVVPKIEAMSDEYLNEIVRIVPFGELPRMKVILQVLIGHGNGHLGRVDYQRALLGLDGLGF